MEKKLAVIISLVYFGVVFAYFLVEPIPLFFPILIYVSVFIPAYIVLKRTRDFGRVFICGITCGVISVAIYIGLCFVAKHYLWLKQIILWPAAW